MPRISVGMRLRTPLAGPLLRIGFCLLLAVLAGPFRLEAQQSSDAATAMERVLTLRDSVALALRQNPDLLLARLDQRDAHAQTETAADPFSMKLSVGSGLAYTSGFPMSVGGTGPSVVNAQAAMTLFDRPQRLRLLEARERAKATAFSEVEKRRMVAMDVARAHLDAESLGRTRDQQLREVESLARMANIRSVQAEAGRVLPLEEKLAAAELARARYRLRETDSALAQAHAQLGFLLGLESRVHVVPAREEMLPAPLPDSAEIATDIAWQGSPALGSLGRQLAASKLRWRAAKSTHWPVVKLVSQYSMFARFNNYDSFYNRFERHNGQIGASFELPLFTGKAPRAAAEEADVEQERLRIQESSTRGKIALQTHQRFQEKEDAWAYHQLTSVELDVARERVNVMLARSAEGRATLLELEQARVEEARKWAEFYRSRALAILRDLELMETTGQLLSYLQQ